MKTNWQHQKDAVTTDQKFRDPDEHLHEIDKRHLKESEEAVDPTPAGARRSKSEEAEPGET